MLHIDCFVFCRQYETSCLNIIQTFCKNNICLSLWNLYNYIKEWTTPVNHEFTNAFSGSEPGTEFGLPDSRPATYSPAPSAPALSNETADGYKPPKYDEVIERDHLNPDANDGRINHDHTSNSVSSNDVVFGSGLTNPSSRGDLDGTESRNGYSANAEGEMPPPPSYDEALSALYQASPSEAEHLHLTM